MSRSGDDDTGLNCRRGYGGTVIQLANTQHMASIMTMVTISKSALKARMLEYFRQVEETGEPLIVTDHGTPVLQVLPFAAKRPMADVLAEFRAIGPVRFTGDPNAPTGDEWDVA